MKDSSHSLFHPQTLESILHQNKNSWITCLVMDFPELLNHHNECFCWTMKKKTCLSLICFPQGKTTREFIWNIPIFLFAASLKTSVIPSMYVSKKLSWVCYPEDELFLRHTWTYCKSAVHSRKEIGKTSATLLGKSSKTCRRTHFALCTCSWVTSVFIFHFLLPSMILFGTHSL